MPTSEEASQIVTRFFPLNSTARIDERWVPLFIVNGQLHNKVQGDTINQEPNAQDPLIGQHPPVACSGPTRLTDMTIMSKTDHIVRDERKGQQRLWEKSARFANSGSRQGRVPNRRERRKLATRQAYWTRLCPARLTKHGCAHRG